MLSFDFVGRYKIAMFTDSFIWLRFPAAQTSFARGNDRCRWHLFVWLNDYFTLLVEMTMPMALSMFWCVAVGLINNYNGCIDNFFVWLWFIYLSSSQVSETSEAGDLIHWKTKSLFLMNGLSLCFALFFNMVEIPCSANFVCSREWQYKEIAGMTI
jgi:hypothetical protein